jgi:hypothetical protein
MISTTIPQFRGDFSIEFDGGLYCAMHGAQSMHKGSGKAAEYKTLAGAVKFLASQNIRAETETVEIAEPVVEEVATTAVAKITEIAATRFTGKHYTATVFVGRYEFIGNEDALSQDDICALINQRFPGARICANDKEFAQKLMELVDA